MHATADSIAANMHPFVSEVDIVVKVGAVDQRRLVGVPCLSNTRALKLGDELLVSEPVKKCIGVKKPEGTYYCRIGYRERWLICVYIRQK